MSNDEVKEVKVGDNIRLYRGEDVKPLDFEISAVIERGVCRVAGTPAFSKSRWTLVESTEGMRVVLESDEYLEAMFTGPFVDGVRLHGCEKAPNPYSNLFGGKGLNRP